MKIKKGSKAKPRELDRKEWYFLKIPKAEMKAAFIYEYARELASRSPASLDLIIRSEGASNVIRTRPRGRVDFKKIMRDHVPDFLRISKRWFPRIPWQGLDHKMRARLLEAANKLFPADKYLREATITELREFRVSIETLGWANQPLVDNEYLHQTPLGLHIHLNKPDSGIKKAFALWLSMERKRQGLPDVKHKPMTGRGSFSDRLNGLGALRLVEHCPDKLYSYTAFEIRGEASYQDVRELRNAAKKAEELLKLLS
jgi:hypothetical protein